MEQSCQLNGGGQDPDGQYSPINSSVQSNWRARAALKDLGFLLKGHCVKMAAYLWQSIKPLIDSVEPQTGQCERAECITESVLNGRLEKTKNNKWIVLTFCYCIIQKHGTVNKKGSLSPALRTILVLIEWNIKRFTVNGRNLQLQPLWHHSLTKCGGRNTL